MSTSVRVLLSTCPDDQAERIAEALLSRRLAACVNALPGVVSRYWWKGKLEASRETLLVVKTEADRVPAVVDALRDVHPYDVPELLSLPVEEGDDAYLRWVAEEVTGSPSPPGTPRRKPGP